MKLCFVTDSEVEAMNEKYKERVESAPDVDGIRSFHLIQPVSENVVKFKFYSLSNHNIYKYFGEPGAHSVKDIWGFITIFHDSAWWVAEVQIREETSVSVKCLHPKGPSRRFAFPERHQILAVNIEDILSVVNPITKDGKVFSLKRADSAYSKEKTLQR